MKVKEKGIDPKTIRRQGASDQSKGGGGGHNNKNSEPRKFNAFREMAKLQKGSTPNLAKIPDTVAVVGTPLTSGGPEKGKKRGREDDEDGNAAKTAKMEVSWPWPNQMAVADDA